MNKRFGSGGGNSGDRTVRICPAHLRGKEVGRSYHNETPPMADADCRVNEQVRPYDETKGVAALLRETFGFEGLEQIAKEPNAILEALPFKTVYSPTYRYERADGSGGTVTGRMSHTRPNPSAEPKRARLPVHIIYEPEDEMQSQPPKSSQPPRDVHALVKAISAGRDKTDAELIAEIACFGGANLEWLIQCPFDDLMKLRTVRQQQRAEGEAARKKLAQQAKAAFLQPLMDTCSAAPSGQEPPRSANAVIAALHAGRSMDEAKDIGEGVSLGAGWTVNDYLQLSPADLQSCSGGATP
jgi:hypothetical protein